MISALNFNSTFYLKIEVFPCRARQDSNLRLLIRSQTRSRTGGYRERHGVVVPSWYERRAALRHTQFSETWGTK